MMAKPRIRPHVLKRIKPSPKSSPFVNSAVKPPFPSFLGLKEGAESERAHKVVFRTELMVKASPMPWWSWKVAILSASYRMDGRIYVKSDVITATAMMLACSMPDSEKVRQSFFNELDQFHFPFVRALGLKAEDFSQIGNHSSWRADPLDDMFGEQPSPLSLIAEIHASTT